MPIDRQAAKHIAASLARSGGGAATAAQVAQSAAVVWRDIETALTPIIGAHGMLALYNRSLHLSTPAHPCLAGVAGTVVGTVGGAVGGTVGGVVVGTVVGAVVGGGASTVGVRAAAPLGVDTALLQAALLQQGQDATAPADPLVLASTAAADMLQHFYELLASLIGPSLTERLLFPVWSTFPSGPPAQGAAR